MFARRLISALSFVTRCALVSSVFVGADATATPVMYAMELHADEVSIPSFPCPGPPRISPGSWNCNNVPPPKAGDEFFGHFTVDDSVLSGGDGEVSAEVAHFFLQIGAIIWSQDQHPVSAPPGSMGFSCPRVPAGCNYILFGFRDAQDQVSGVEHGVLGFVLANHEIVGLTGGVFGQADFPFVDFFGLTYSAMDVSQGGLSGRLEINRVSEPTTMSMFVLAVISAVWVRKVRGSVLGYVSYRSRR